MATKADKITHDQRVELVYRMILDGWTSPQIVQNVSQKWGMTTRQGYGYVRAAYARVRNDAEEYRKAAFDEHILARRKLRRDTGDVRLKLAILQDEAKLLSLYPADKHEHMGKDGSPLFPVDELVSLLRQADEALIDGSQ